MARMAWTRTLVDASGFRPTASQAFQPIKPTARAAPNAARPTCKLPFMDLFLLSRRPREHGRPTKVISTLRGLWALRLLLAKQQREDSGQQHKDQRLNDTYKQL